MQPARSSQPKGQTLLEGIVAIGVIMVGVVGSLVLINTTSHLGQVNTDRVIAQNLAREGMELTYSLRNSASLDKIHDQSLSWDSYLYANVYLSANVAAYLSKYNLGKLVGGKCLLRCTPSSVETHGLCDTNYTNPVPADASPEEQDCDIKMLYNYLTRNISIKPPACAGTNVNPDRAALGTTTAPDDCKYGGGLGSVVDLQDASTMKNDIETSAYHYTTGYPMIAAIPTVVDGRLDEYVPIDTSKIGPTIDLATIWSDPRAQVLQASSSYLQDIPLALRPAGTVGTRFYRVVTTQEVCSGTKPDPFTPGQTVPVNAVVPSTSTLNCNAYLPTVDGAVTHTSIQKIGVFVTSEVRWPTVSSATKVKYEEFLYDWINP